MTIQVVTYDLGSHHIEIDHEWHPVAGDEPNSRQDAQSYCDALARNDKSTDHVTYVREID